MNILVPMAGDGSRFRDAGYSTPKPFLEVKPGITLIDVAIQPFIGLGDFLFFVRREHVDFIPTRHKIVVENLTEGSACTVLLAKDNIDYNTPILIVNSDQIVRFDQDKFKYLLTHTCPDGVIFTFESDDPKFSYARVNTSDVVLETAEKRVISDQATCGVYYFKKWGHFLKAAEEMIEADDRFNGEFYNAPVYNYLINRGGLVKTFKVDKMICLGTPDEYERYKTNQS